MQIRHRAGEHDDPTIVTRPTRGARVVDVLRGALHFERMQHETGSDIKPGVRRFRVPLADWSGR